MSEALRSVSGSRATMKLRDAGQHEAVASTLRTPERSRQHELQGPCLEGVAFGGQLAQARRTSEALVGVRARRLSGFLRQLVREQAVPLQIRDVLDHDTSLCSSGGQG